MDNQERWYRDNLPLEGAVVADVGANIGRLSQFFWEQVGPQGRVVSIEPQPENLRELERRAEGHANWRIEACAVSDREGTVLMRTFDVPYGKNSMVVSDAGELIREVVCKRLEDLVPDATVIKVDIEGHEYHVLPNAVAALAQARAWALELHMVEGHPLEETLQMFSKAGYRVLAAGRKREDPEGAWLSVRIPVTLSWDKIPGTPTEIDGIPGLFKMLHVLAVRQLTANR
ncbi:MAG TPA: FkbM family methyltransferase [Polyangiaceae bacterium]|nr:FkbM family methyltransferase [Polyangiaceae bacterium]